MGQVKWKISKEGLESLSLWDLRHETSIREGYAPSMKKIDKKIDYLGNYLHHFLLGVNFDCDNYICYIILIHKIILIMINYYDMPYIIWYIECDWFYVYSIHMNYIEFDIDNIMMTIAMQVMSRLCVGKFAIYIFLVWGNG